ncbi:unnamed protein product, partial [Vitis vinifera]
MSQVAKFYNKLGELQIMILLLNRDN